MIRSLLRLAATVALGFALLPSEALAYVDPNAGGMLLQLLAPVFAACAGAWLFLRRWLIAFVRRYWQRLSGRSRDE